MFESTLLINTLHFILTGLVGLVAYFFRQAQRRQDLCNAKTEQKIDDLLEKVQFTNGRLIMLEEWRKNNSDRVDEIHEDAQTLRKRLEGLLFKVMEIRTPRQR